jgi:hypothetical protein
LLLVHPTTNTGGYISGQAIAGIVYIGDDMATATDGDYGCP